MGAKVGENVGEEIGELVGELHLPIKILRKLNNKTEEKIFLKICYNISPKGKVVNLMTYRGRERFKIFLQMLGEGYF